MFDETQSIPACGESGLADSSESGPAISYRLLQKEHCKIHQADDAQKLFMNLDSPCSDVVLLNVRRRLPEGPLSFDSAESPPPEVAASCLTAVGENASQRELLPIAATGAAESDEAGVATSQDKRRFQGIPIRLAEEARLPSRRESDTVWRLFSDVVDVVERRAMEDNRRQRQALLHCLDDAGVVGIAFLRRSGELEEANTVFLRLLGLNCDDVQAGAIEWLELVVPEMRDSIRRRLREIYRGASVRPQEIMCLGSDGVPLPLLFAAAHLPDDGSLILFLLSISDRESLEPLLRLSHCHLQDLAMHGNMSMELERRRIAREIHDEQGSLLTALKLDLSLLRRELSEITPVVGERLESMQQLLDEMVRAMRQVASQLRPAALNMGLLPSLQWLVQDFEKRTGIGCHLDVVGALALDDVRATALFRIVQESLTNVTRHAAASVVDICLALRGERLCLQIRDDGFGFDPANAGNFTLGLKGMYERLELLGGCLNIDSAPGRGTLLQIFIPLTTPAGDDDDFGLDNGHEDLPPAQAFV